MRKALAALAISMSLAAAPTHIASPLFLKTAHAEIVPCTGTQGVGEFVSDPTNHGSAYADAWHSDQWDFSWCPSNQYLRHPYTQQCYINDYNGGWSGGTVQKGWYYVSSSHGEAWCNITGIKDAQGNTHNMYLRIEEFNDGTSYYNDSVN
jgi:hypothetical protein